MLKRLWTTLSVAVGVVLLAEPARAEVLLEFKDGLVTIVAVNATTLEILERWMAVGGTRILNLNDVVGTPLTLELRGVPERVALDILLRPFSGHMAAARTTTHAAGQSVFAGILILATSRPIAATRPVATGARPPPPVWDEPSEAAVMGPTPPSVPAAPVQPGPALTGQTPPSFPPLPTPSPGLSGLPANVGAPGAAARVPGPFTPPSGPFNVAPGTSAPAPPQPQYPAAVPTPTQPPPQAPSQPGR